jgi:hypothetical protein
MTNKIDKNRKTSDFAGIKMTGRFASTSVEDMRRAGREAGIRISEIQACPMSIPDRKQIQEKESVRAAEDAKVFEAINKVITFARFSLTSLEDIRRKDAIQNAYYDNIVLAAIKKASK